MARSHAILLDTLPQAAMVVSTDTTIVAANLAAGRLVDIDPDQIEGSKLSDMVSDAAGAIAYVRGCSRTRAAVPGSLVLCAPNGKTTPCFVRGSLAVPRSGARAAEVLLQLVSRVEAPGALADFTRRVNELSREIARRREVEGELRESRGRLEVTLRSIGDAVIATDERGRVTMLNVVAQQLTGWSNDDAVGQPLDKVFHIVNERTRDLVEAPVARVLREGHVIGLANHTVLIARDGTEWPIDDSAAPIRDGERMVGVVLIFREISAAKRLDELLRKRAEDLQVAARRKDEFLAMLGHELRNPLAAVVSGFAVVQRTRDETIRSRAYETVARQLRHITRLVDDLLDVARITRGRVELKRERVSLDAILQSAIASASPIFDRRGQHFAVKVEVGAAELDADPTRLEQALGNLLHNASKYTPEGGHIALSAVLTPGGRVAISVRDDGQGIPAALLPDIFDLFVQEQRALHRAQGGLGIGLTVVKHLVGLHGGRVVARSDGPGHGSEFIIELPLAETRPVFERDEVRVDQPEPTSLRLSVLIVDDNRDAAFLLAELLGLLGYARVQVASDGVEALEIARAVTPDVFLIDVGMPRMDGYEVAAHLRGMEPLANKLLIAVTGYGQADDVARAKSAGFDAHMTKPVDADELDRILRAAGAKVGSS